MPSKQCGEKQNIPERITDAYIAAMLLVFPLFTGLSGYANITFSKYLFFVIITLLWLVSLLIFSLRLRIAPRIKPQFWMPCAAFMLICTLSALLSDHFPETFIGAGRYDGLATQLLCACIFLGTAIFAKPKAWHFAILGISASLCCIVAVFQLFNINLLGLFPNNLSYYDAHIKYTGEFLGTMGNVDILTAYLSMCIPVFFAALIKARSAREFLFVIPLALSVFTLCSAATAAGFAALAAWAVIFIPAMCRNLQKLSRALILCCVIILAAIPALAFNGGINDSGFYFSFDFSALSAALVAASLVCAASALIFAALSRRYDLSPRSLIYLAASTAGCIALIFVWGYNGTEGTLYEFSQILRGNFDDSFGSSRILIWRTVLEAAVKKPLLGHGPDVLPFVIDIDFSRYVPQTGKTLTTFVDNAHNIYLGYFAGIGIIGLICFLLTAGFALIASRRSRYAFAVSGAAAAYLVHSFFGLGLCLVSPIFWLFLGLCAASDKNIFPEE